MIIVLEGPDGSGKTTIAQACVEQARVMLGRPTKYFRDPGSTTLGEALRKMLLDPEVQVTPLQQMLLFSAGRLALIDQIKAWLTENESGIAFVDRFVLSTLVYQSMNGVPIPDILLVNRLLCDRELGQPAYTILVDPGDEVLAQRNKARSDKKDRFERMDMAVVARNYRRFIQTFDSVVNWVGTVNSNQSINACVYDVLKIVHQVEANAITNKIKKDEE